jgi:hypothetical protein
MCLFVGLLIGVVLMRPPAPPRAPGDDPPRHKDETMGPPAPVVKPGENEAKPEKPEKDKGRP